MWCGEESHVEWCGAQECFGLDWLQVVSSVGHSTAAGAVAAE